MTHDTYCTLLPYKFPSAAAAVDKIIQFGIKAVSRNRNSEEEEEENPLNN